MKSHTQKKCEVMQTELNQYLETMIINKINEPRNNKTNKTINNTSTTNHNKNNLQKQQTKPVKIKK